MRSERFHGWSRPGPLPPGGLEAGPGETLDYLCGHWQIFQLQKGQRNSVDDQLAAWWGTRWCPHPARIADLGSGIGSVALMAAWKCPGAILHTVEAQPVSHALAQKSCRYNGLEERCFVHLGDLREAAILEPHGRFDLVLGTPPYWPLGSKVPAESPQAVSARLEIRGGLEDYALAAARLLAPGGLFACVFPKDQRVRALEAFRSASLALLQVLTVQFKEGEPYGLLLLAGSRTQDVPPSLHSEPLELPVHTVRDREGRFTREHSHLRLSMGFPPGK
jgi:tRNA1(Val) A37 N6-methylase TrmN6